MLKEILEDEQPAVKSLNKSIDKMIKDKNQNGLDILAQELGKILKGLKK